MGEAIRSGNGRRVPSGVRAGDRRARRRAARVPADRRRQERDGRRDRPARGSDDRASPGRPARAGAPRIHARLRAQVGAVVAAGRELRARSRQSESRCPRATRDRRRLQGSYDHGAELPEEDRLRLGRGEARPPDGQRPGGAGGRSRAARGRRTRMEVATAAQSHRRHPRSAGGSPKACTRIRTAGEPGASTSNRRTPFSRIRRDGYRTTRWCSTAAAGPTAASSSSTYASTGSAFPFTRSSGSRSTTVPGGSR